MCNIVFFGSGDFPIPTFKYLIGEGYKISGLVTSNDKVLFNNERLYDIAKKAGIPTFVPSDLKSKDFIEWLAEKEADIFCIISYKILPMEVVRIPSLGCFNVHASLLPFLKGSSPIYWAIENDLPTTGITSFIIDENVDCGDIILNKSIDIDENETYGSLHNKLSEESCALTEKTINILSNKYEDFYYRFLKQPNYKGYKLHYAPKLTSEDKRLRGNVLYCDIYDTYRRIRALSPNIGVNCEFHIRRLYDIEALKIPFKIYDAELVDASPEWHCDIYGCYEQMPIMTDGKTYMYLTSETSNNKVISVKTIQLCGKKKMCIADFLNGFKYLKNKGEGYFIEVK